MQEEEDDMEFVPWSTDDNESTSGTAVSQSKANTGNSISHRSFSGGSSPPNSHHSTTERPFHGSAPTDYWERSNDFIVKAKRVLRPCLVEGFFLVKRYKVVAVLFLLFSLSYLFLRTQGSPGKAHESEKQHSEEQTLILELKDDISTLTASYEQEKDRIKQLVEQLRRLQEKELEDREREEKLRRELSQSEMERRDLEERQREEKVRKMQSEYEQRIEQMKENEKKKVEELVKEAEEQKRVFREELRKERLEQTDAKCEESNKLDLEDALRTARQKELELETKISKITAEAEERESNLQQRLQELRQDVIASKKEAREAKERLLQNLDEQSALTREKRNTEKVEMEEGEEELPKPFVRRDSRQGWSLDLSDEVTDSMDDGIGGNAHEEEEEEEEESEQDEENIGETIEGSNTFMEVTKIDPDQGNLFGTEPQLKTSPQRSKPSLGLDPEEEEEEEEETKGQNVREVLFLLLSSFFSLFSFYSKPFESRLG